MKSLILVLALVLAANLLTKHSLLAQASTAVEASPIPGNFSAPRPLVLAQNAGEYSSSVGKTYRNNNFKSSPPPVLIQFSPGEDKMLDALTEDLNIMAHLLEKNLEREVSQETPSVKMGIQMTLTGGSSSVRAMYLESFGALFLVKVNFPLLGPNSEEEKKVEEHADSDWENTKKELSGEKRQTGEAVEIYSFGADYDRAQVESMKSALLQTLRNASNIRYLKPEEFIGVTVFGSPTVLEKVRPSKSRNAKSESNLTRDLAKAGTNRDLASRARRGTVMTFRIKKSDVDSFSKQKLSFDEFQTRAVINSYFGSGYATTSLNTWSQNDFAPAGLGR
jgi:hypothetical protein